MARRFDRREILAQAGTVSAATLLAACKPTGAQTETSKAPQVRAVTRVLDSQPTIEGAGVHLRRALGGNALSLLDPFLLLDEFHSDRPEDYVKGFPSHPHRGFETVTYMLEGAMEHRDSIGNSGRLGPGSSQWMTAGHGIIHSEMPQQQNGLMWGFQLWVNLPAAQKLKKPRYQDIPPQNIPEIALGECVARLVAGDAGGHTGPVSGIVTAPQMLDVKVPARGRLEHDTPRGHNCFAYVFEGGVTFGTGKTPAHATQLVVFGPGDRVVAESVEGGRFMFFAGAPIGEPVARYGPFVMNTDAELQQAVDDYRSGKLVEI